MEEKSLNAFTWYVYQYVLGMITVAHKCPTSYGARKLSSCLKHPECLHYTVVTDTEKGKGFYLWQNVTQYENNV